MMCTQLSAVTCHTERLNCIGGATILLVRPTSIEECCNRVAGGVSFYTGLECTNCTGICIYSCHAVVYL